MTADEIDELMNETADRFELKQEVQKVADWMVEQFVESYNRKNDSF